MSTTTCVDIDGNTHSVPTTALEWRPAAYGIVIRNNSILLARHFGKYTLPGGGIELGEVPEEAVVREIFEETGIVAVNPQLLGVENSFFHWNGTEKKYFHGLLLYYRCEFSGGKLSADGFDEEEKSYGELAEWVSLDELDQLTVGSTVDYRPYIRKALSLR